MQVGVIPSYELQVGVMPSSLSLCGASCSTTCTPTVYHTHTLLRASNLAICSPRAHAKNLTVIRLWSCACPPPLPPSSSDATEGATDATDATDGQTIEEDRNKDAKPKKAPTLIGRVFKLLPMWVTHLLSNRFLDSDLAFLHYQEHELARRGAPCGNQDALKLYYMPAQPDRAPAALRTWIGRFAKLPRPLPPAMANRAELFDRYHQVRYQFVPSGSLLVRTIRFVISSCRVAIQVGTCIAPLRFLWLPSDPTRGSCVWSAVCNTRASLAHPCHACRVGRCTSPRVASDERPLLTLRARLVRNRSIPGTAGTAERLSKISASCAPTCIACSR
jgi:hypothetical protein